MKNFDVGSYLFDIAENQFYCKLPRLVMLGHIRCMYVNFDPINI